MSISQTYDCSCKTHNKLPDLKKKRKSSGRRDNEDMQRKRALFKAATACERVSQDTRATQALAPLNSKPRATSYSSQCQAW